MGTTRQLAIITTITGQLSHRVRRKEMDRMLVSLVVLRHQAKSKPERIVTVSHKTRLRHRLQPRLCSQTRTKAARHPLALSKRNNLLKPENTLGVAPQNISQLIKINTLKSMVIRLVSITSMITRTIRVNRINLGILIVEMTKMQGRKIPILLVPTLVRGRIK